MNDLAVAIVHYHLRRGGVTRVIETASDCLTEAGVRHVVLSSTEPESGRELPFEIVDELAYQKDGSASITGLHIVRALRRAARKALGTDRITWHLHNHSIGKSRHFSDAAGILAESGDPLVLQYHDFAEDGRPKSYPVIADSETLYPHAPQIRHAFINSRDRSYLTAAGLPEPQTALLPNAVTPPATIKSRPVPAAAPLILYPVRGIRRKNIGELFLLAALSPRGCRYTVSLPPENPRWSPYYEEWTAFAADTGLPVMLGSVGEISPRPKTPRTFESWVRHSTHFITTSVAEGFGLGFLEPATIGKPLLGRNLAMVTNDFANEGIIPGRLYDRLLIPESWVGLETLRQRLVRAMRGTLESYGQPMSNQHLERSFSAIRHNKHLDFGNLPEDLQRQVIHRLLAGTDEELVLAEIDGSTQPLQDWLVETLACNEPTVQKEQLSPYSPPAYLQRLLSLYSQVSETPATAPRYLPKHRVLAQFLKPGSFHFLRS